MPFRNGVLICCKRLTRVNVCCVHQAVSSGVSKGLSMGAMQGAAPDMLSFPEFIGF